MTTFTLNSGNAYTQQDNGYCFATVGGKKTRCSFASFKMAHDQFVREENERQNAANEFVNIDPIEECEAQLDAAAENPEISAEQFVKLIEQAEESATTEEIKKIQKEMAPKKARKSKVATEQFNINGTRVNLTPKQVDFIRHLSDTYFWENGLDSVIWVDCLCDDIQGQFANKPMTVGAMISTLCEKGLGTRATERRDGRKCTSFALTELGKRVAAELGLH